MSPRCRRLRSLGIWRGVLVVILLAATWAASSGCASSSGIRSAPAHVLRERMRNVKEGQPSSEVHRILGDVPVRKPGHPGEPFSTPLHRVSLRPPDGTSVIIETYVVATRPMKGCPDFLYEDVPVVFVDDIVAGRSWEFVEWNWRAWGGGLDRLRWIQDRHRCPDDLKTGIGG